jgi:hypothetical protein
MQQGRFLPKDNPPVPLRQDDNRWPYFAALGHIQTGGPVRQTVAPGHFADPGTK